MTSEQRLNTLAWKSDPRSAVNSFKSWPEEKTGPSCPMTTTLIKLVEEASFKCWNNSDNIAKLNALRFLAWLRVIVLTAPLSSTTVNGVVPESDLHNWLDVTKDRGLPKNIRLRLGRIGITMFIVPRFSKLIVGHLVHLETLIIGYNEYW